MPDCALPICSPDETACFPKRIAKIFNRLQAVPAAVTRIEDTSVYTYTVLFFMMKREDVSFISGWHPGFLLQLFHSMHTQKESLINDIEHGTMSVEIADSIKRSLLLHIKPAPKRAAQLKKILFNGNGPVLQKVWPCLKVISCWCDGTAQLYAEQLRTHFPDVHIQSRGLSTTEGIISIPMHSTKGSVLAVSSAYMDFVSCKNPKFISSISQLQRGERYSVIITNGSGLYRYALHDIIEVIDMFHATPVIRFVAKEKEAIDHRFEKQPITQILQLGLAHVAKRPDIVKGPSGTQIQKSLKHRSLHGATSAMQTGYR